MLHGFPRRPDHGCADLLQEWTFQALIGGQPGAFAMLGNILRGMPPLFGDQRSAPFLRSGYPAICAHHTRPAAYFLHTIGSIQGGSRWRAALIGP